MKALLLLALAVPAAAGPAADYKFTAGPDGYRGHNASVSYEHASGLEASAGLTASRSDSSSTTLKAYSARAGYLGESWSAGVSGGLTPKSDGYSSEQFGADGSWTLLRDRSEDGSGWSLALDASFTRFHHEDEQPTCPGGRRICLRRARSATRTLTLDQNDAGGGLRLRRGGWALTLAGTASLYDQDPEALASPRGRTLAGLASVVEGYPTDNLYAKLSRDVGSRVWLWASASRTSFHLGAPVLLATEAGLGVSLGRGFELSASGSRQKTSEDAAKHYVSAGLSWRLPDGG